MEHRPAFIGPLSEADFGRIAEVRAYMSEIGLPVDDISDHQLHGDAVIHHYEHFLCSPEGAESLPLVDARIVDEDSDTGAELIGSVRDDKRTNLTFIYLLANGTYVKA